MSTESEREKRNEPGKESREQQTDPFHEVIIPPKDYVKYAYYLLLACLGLSVFIIVGCIVAICLADNSGETGFQVFVLICIIADIAILAILTAWLWRLRKDKYRRENQGEEESLARKPENSRPTHTQSRLQSEQSISDFSSQ